MNIPPLNLEVERIYFQVIRNDYKTLAFASTESREGVTSLATAIAQRSLLAGKSTLVVDLNLYHPSLESQGMTTVQSERGLLPNPELVGVAGEHAYFTGIIAPSKRETIMELRRPGSLEAYLEEWHKDYDLVIFDTSPMSRLNANNIPPERVAAAADGTIFVVMAGQTTTAMAAESVKKLNDAGAHILGSVINDKNNPSLKVEILREIGRLKKRLPKLAGKLRKMVLSSHLLSLEI
ncbi:protein SypD [Enterovibrio norvegicus]|uniref:Chromosome partitioning ATPase, Mrp family, contains Fe-S cluster n=2 Tax=Enterovibrio norvegicus TaxID=188144 RepID=A0A1I5M8Q3_9GAMM|nr:tyrosine-protein kinase family protein [Enterovibrio norvegicus]MCC4796673.1 tyrosine-protein kinase family protein [Enterovibrio norvegicus]OEE49571.1 protein SypD [Enterovibrio norvegicus]OEF55487.1 protein SypD [Enterovibrio norvegicus]OEF61000.1 protein SypD [Enterovibrio norvegicus]PMH60833.1 protein SypD [Enterovibrio norvegicus]